MAEDSEEELLLVSYLYTLYRQRSDDERYKRKFWVHSTIRNRENLGEYSRLVQELRLDSIRFQQYFRMSPSVFEELVNAVGPYIEKMNTTFRTAISPQQRIAITLRYVS